MDDLAYITEKILLGDNKNILKEITEQQYEIIEKYYYDKKITISPNETITFRNTPIQSVDHKPRGLWYGIGTSWIDFVHNNMIRKIVPFVFEVEAVDNSIKKIKTLDELYEFNEKYGQKSYDGYFNYIDWTKVSKEFGGIEISPYQGMARMDRRVFWYYTWDVASGCIWDETAIKGVKRII